MLHWVLLPTATMKAETSRVRYDVFLFITSASWDGKYRSTFSDLHYGALQIRLQLCSFDAPCLPQTPLLLPHSCCAYDNWWTHTQLRHHLHQSHDRWEVANHLFL